jgi:hypothetical protein
MYYVARRYHISFEQFGSTCLSTVQFSVVRKSWRFVGVCNYTIDECDRTPVPFVLHETLGLFFPRDPWNPLVIAPRSERATEY